MELEKDHIIFNHWNKKDWLQQVYSIYQKYRPEMLPRMIVFSFVPSFTCERLEPLHLVTFACLIHYLDKKGHLASLDSSNNRHIHDYIFNDLNMAAYWKGGQNHVDATSSEQIFNLWRIIEEEKDLYAKNVEEYFKRNYFKNKDLSAISVSLVEAFYNVFDHADANGNAYSMIFYDKEKQMLSYAVADFGIGIPTSVRKFKPEIRSDEDAILWAIEDNSTVHSTKRNRGFGMSNILTAATTARIFSNKGLIVRKNDSYRMYHIDNFSFPGTLIYLTIDMNSFEEEEIVESITFTI